MTTNNYSLSTASKLLHDTDDAADNITLDALVASGDCFITLATQLDALTHDGTENPVASSPLLEQTIKTLIYLQRHYNVVKKQPNYRQ